MQCCENQGFTAKATLGADFWLGGANENGLRAVCLQAVRCIFIV